MAQFEFYQGDCLDILPNIASGCVDMILCDLPYGTTDCAWDSVIPMEPLFAQYKRIAKENAAIVLTAQQPFATDLINAWRKAFRYELIWEKNCPLGFFNANKMPLRAHENILVFYRKLPTYNPQKTFGHKKYTGDRKPNKPAIYSTARKGNACTDGSRFPKSILKFQNVSAALRGLHPTQKPVDMFEWLIRTYTNTGETVLDNGMGSGTTGVACANTGRRFIGIERDEKYFAMAKERTEAATTAV